MIKKQSKSKKILPIFFFLLIFLTSGEDNTWFEIITSSVIFSLMATFISTLIYQFFVFLFNPMRLINKQDFALLVDDILEEKESKNI